MAHFASGFLALSLLVLVPAFGSWGYAFLVIPIVASLAIFRFRTVADRQAVTAQTLLGSRKVAWADIDGLAFTKSAWARAHLTGGEKLMLPAVTFATVPRLTAASGGRVPDPFVS